MAQTGKSPAGTKVNGVNGHTPVKKNGGTDSSRSNGKKRSRETTEEDAEMEDTSQRRSRPSSPSSTPKASKTVYMRDEGDLDANDDDELARMSNRSQGKLKKRKSGANVTDQDRKFDAEKRRERAKRLGVETATLPVNTGMLGCSPCSWILLIPIIPLSAQDQLVKSILANDTVIVRTLHG
jgi:hypothetical protein